MLAYIGLITAIACYIAIERSAKIIKSSLTRNERCNPNKASVYQQTVKEYRHTIKQTVVHLEEG